MNEKAWKTGGKIRANSHITCSCKQVYSCAQERKCLVFRGDIFHIDTKWRADKEKPRGTSVSMQSLCGPVCEMQVKNTIADFCFVFKEKQLPEAGILSKEMAGVLSLGIFQTLPPNPRFIPPDGL